jgi:hypothetical protein
MRFRPRQIEFLIPQDFIARTPLAASSPFRETLFDSGDVVGVVTVFPKVG